MAESSGEMAPPEKRFRAETSEQSAESEEICPVHMLSDDLLVSQTLTPQPLQPLPGPTLLPYSGTDLLPPAVEGEAPPCGVCLEAMESRDQKMGI